MEKYFPEICFYFHTISLYLELLLSGKIFPKDFGTNWLEGEWVQIGLMVRSVFRLSLEAAFLYKLPIGPGSSFVSQQY